ncbi:hypothetical protein GCM10010385_03780 [Streptomyces geysiriensis]|nr:hypothetical protein GCM10010385_03780 [Streptomyces geysiriensis]
MCAYVPSRPAWFGTLPADVRVAGRGAALVEVPADVRVEAPVEAPVEVPLDAPVEVPI